MEWRTEDPDYFRKRLRMTTDQLDTLLQKVTPLIQKCETNMREALSPKIKLEITLFLATGDNYSTLAESFRVPECTISKFLKDVLDAIYNVLQEYITWICCSKWKSRHNFTWLLEFERMLISSVDKFQDNQCTKIQKDFFDRWQFPFCCGALGGKHVLIQNPPRGASDYFNYKGSYRVVLPALVDENYPFIYICKQLGNK
ncbi:hypothetical protein NQ318_013203 [Aromia moschata]|uniref:Transposase Helix-turn-helix domain-containing protein n=1 Tax=Aromia moschata TaxID=1265417 RepID=A0AAV8XH60_9CUCU|nr:hypothetical protein NQ318_013203 [Aromia moschata]